MKKFDAVIIGFGKGGKTLAVDLAKRGKTVAVVEHSSKMYGGTCINVGCIPTKFLVFQSRAACAEAAVSFEQKAERYRQVIAEKTALVEDLRQKNFNNLNGNENITVITGHASFVSASEIKIKTRAETFSITGENIFINTGAEPVIPHIPGIHESRRIYTSASLMSLEELPRRLVIVGGGYIGLEFASIYAAFGSQVTVLEGAGRLMPREDRDMVESMAAAMAAQGIDIRLNAQVLSFRDEETETAVSYKEADGETKTLPADAVLVAVGRRPNTDALDLHAAGVRTTPQGAVVVNERLQTSIPGIWAMGDVRGGPQFTYISLDDYRIVRETLFGDAQKTTADQEPFPYAVFLNPPFARVGMSEEQARADGRSVRVSKISVGSIPRMRISNEKFGMLKGIVDAETQEILGCAMFCRDANEVINMMAAAIKAGVPYTFMRDAIYTHPSVSETMNELFSDANLMSV